MNNVFWGVHGAVSQGANPAALLIGDSWFWYPIDNLALELGSTFTDQQFVVVGQNGAEAAQWSEKYRKDIDFGFRMYGSGVQALLLSGGGNDIAGMSDFLRLLQDDCSKATTVEECYRQGQPDAVISKIIGAYREVVLRFRAYNYISTVFVHNYDNAWPTGRGFFGPGDWLKMPMDKARVPQALRRPLFKDLLERLREAQVELATEAAMAPMMAIKSAGTMPDDPGNIDKWWENELHPTMRGFKRLVAQAFAPELRKIHLT